MPSISPLNDSSIKIAASALRAGNLVAFPTETVYGLGADATNDTAVAKIFEAKGRPKFNPLIVHFPDMDGVENVAELSPLAIKLAAQFWPGPISFVLPRKADAGLSLLVSAGLPSVAARIPAHEGARRLLQTAGIPIAAPSANRSGRISPTTAAHVAADFGEEVAYLLDIGPCAVGVESTVIDLTETKPLVLRPGGITAEQIEAAIGHPVDVAPVNKENPKSPGMLLSHYAPQLPIRLNANAANDGEALLGFGPSSTATMNLSVRGDLVEAAANLFAYLHDLDDPKWSGIAISPIPEQGLGCAINDRLRRAAAPRP